MDTLKIGQLITSEQNRDAIHMAIAPVIAAEKLAPGDHVGLLPDGRASEAVAHIGIIDPFLKKAVRAGDKCWLFLYPGSITSLRHEWAHPAFTAESAASSKSYSETWMRAWAIMHMGEDYYGGGDKLDPDTAYKNAIEAGHNMSVGPYEDARDSMHDEWWTHWEAITGKKGDRDGYFSCAC